MPVRIRILKKTHPFHTSGAYVQSPTQLISGTAVPSLAPDVNTATFFDGIVVSRIFASEAPARKRGSRREKKVSESRANFDMMPADAVRQAVTQPITLRAVNTPLATKAQEEMSDFERDYPW
jgi:hypothetical protein